MPSSELRNERVFEDLRELFFSRKGRNPCFSGFLGIYSNVPGKTRWM
jgi:hypothetical protein